MADPLDNDNDDNYDNYDDIGDDFDLNFDEADAAEFGDFEIQDNDYEINDLIENIQNESLSVVERQDYFQDLNSLAQTERYRDLMFNSTTIFPMLARYLENPPIPAFQDHTTVCLWYLSRSAKAAVPMCLPETQIIVKLARLLAQNPPFKDNILKCLSNISLHPEAHLCLFSPEINFLRICYDEIVENQSFSHSFQTIGCIALSIDFRFRDLLLEYPFIPEFYNHLFNGGPPISWESRFQGQLYWCLNFLTSISSWRKQNQKILNCILSQCPHFFLYFHSIATTTNEMESIKSLFILCNLFHGYYTNQSREKRISGQDYESSLLSNILDVSEKKSSGTFYFARSCTYKLLDLYCLLLDGNGHSAEYLHLSGIGFAFGITKLRDVTACFASLTYYPNNCIFLCNHESYFDRLIYYSEITLSLFVEGDDERKAFGQVAMESSGGGRNDQETVENILILTLNLLHFFLHEQESSHKSTVQDVRDLFEQIDPLYKVIEEIFAIPKERNISEDIIILTKILMEKHEGITRLLEL